MACECAGISSRFRYKGSYGKAGRNNPVTWRNILRAVLGLLPAFETEESDRDESTNSESDGDEAASFAELSGVDVSPTTTESLERTLDRAESVLGDQLTDLSDVHDRAIRTVRITAVLLGATASVLQLSPAPVLANVWLKVSGVLLVTSIGTGIVASSASSPDYGPGPEYVRPNIESGDPNEEVYLELLQGFSEAISYNRTAVNESERYLFVTQLLLVSSIVSGSVVLIVL